MSYVLVDVIEPGGQNDVASIIPVEFHLHNARFGEMERMTRTGGKERDGGRISLNRFNALGRDSATVAAADFAIATVTHGAPAWKTKRENPR